MDDWTKSTEGLTAKVQQLDTVLAAQKSKLAGLKAEYERVKAEQGENSTAARNLYIKMQNQQAVVNQTEKEFKNYSNTLKQAEAGTINLSDVVLRNGKAVERTSRNTENNSDALHKNIDKLIENAVETKKVTKLKGELSAAEAKYAAALKKANGSTEKIRQATQEFENELRRIQGELTAVSEAQDKAGKSAENFGTVMGGVAKGIAAIGAAAVAAVGSFFALAESTRESREDMAKLTSSFEGAKLSSKSAEGTFKSLYGVIGETDTAVEAAQQIALLANSEEEAAKWAEQAANVTATFGDALKPETYFEAANETLKLGEATGAFTQMLEGTGVNVDEFNSHLASLTTEQEKQAYMLEVSEKAMGEAGKAYKETAGDIIAAREAEAEMSLALQELGAIAEPIMTELKLLAVDLLKAIQPAVELIGTGLKGVMDGTAGAADTLAEGIGSLITTLAEKLVSALPMAIETLVSLISTIVPQLLSTLAEQTPTVLQAVITGFTQLLETIGEMLPELIPVIISAVLTITETLLANVDKIIDAGISLLMGLADGLIAALPVVAEKAPIIIDKLVSAIASNLPKLLAMGIELILKLGVGLLQAIPQLVSSIPKIITSIVQGFADGHDSMLKTGKALLEGIWDGIKNGAQWLKDKITGFAGNVADWFKETFKINSPSKLMADDVGIYVGQGVGEGILNSMPSVKKQLGKFSQFVTDNIGNIKAGLTIGTTGKYAVAGAGATVGGGNSTVIDARQNIYYNGKLSLKEQKKLDQNHYTTVKMKLQNEGAIKK